MLQINKPTKQIPTNNIAGKRDPVRAITSLEPNTTLADLKCGRCGRNHHKTIDCKFTEELCKTCTKPMKIHSRECKFKIQDDLYDQLKTKSVRVVEEVEVVEGECETVISVGGWCGSIQMEKEGETPNPEKKEEERKKSQIQHRKSVPMD